MKRKKTGCFFVLFALVAVLCGFALPNLTENYETRQLLEKIDTYESEEVQFPTSYHVLDCMKLLACGYDEVELDTGKTHETEDLSEICQTVLTNFGIDNEIFWSDAQITEQTNRVFLAVSSGQTQDSEENIESSDTEKKYRSFQGNSASDKDIDYDSIDHIVIDKNDSDGRTYSSYEDCYEGLLEDLQIDGVSDNFSAIIWECEITDQYEDKITIWVDDLSGKMIGFRIAYGEEWIDSDYADVNYFLQERFLTENILYMLQDYYGLTDVSFIYGYIANFWLIFTDKTGERVFVPILTNDDSGVLGFNYYEDGMMPF
jgi:hypothetical protein